MENDEHIVKKQQPNKFLRVILYIFLYGIIPWPLLFLVNIVGIVLAGFMTLPFSFDFSKYDTLVRVIFMICVVLPYFLSGILYFFIYRVLVEITGAFNLLFFILVIIPTMICKILIIYILTQISFFSSHEPMSVSSALIFVTLEIMIILGTGVAYLQNSKRKNTVVKN